MSSNNETFNCLWGLTKKKIDLVVNRFILMALKKIKINLFGGDSWRPFISVNDVSRAMIKTLYSKNDKVRKQIFNLGGEKKKIIGL